MRRLLIALPLMCLLSQAGASWAYRTSLEDAVSEARERYDGRILSADTVYDDEGRAFYRLRILTPDGRVRRIRMRPDARGEDHGRHRGRHEDHGRREHRD
jgi:hypothetical protein